MRKLNIYFLILILFFSYGSGLQGQTIVYDLDEDFATDVSNWGFTLNDGGAQTIAYAGANKLLQVRWPNSSSEYIKTLSSVITPGTDGKVKVEFIIKAYTSGNASNYGALYLLDESGNAITGFHLRRGSIGGSNKWFVGRATSYLGTAYAYPASADGLNANEPLAKITFDLDFGAKTLDFSAVQGTFDYTSRVFTAEGATVSSTGQAFINASASNIKSISSWYLRAASLAGTNGLDIMKVGVSALRNVATANVTIQYKDQNNDDAKPERVVADQPVGTSFTATLEDKGSFSANGFYYAYDAAATASDRVDVAEEGSQIVLKFKKIPLTAGTYTWSGAFSANWNEIDENFSTDGVNALGYQKSNAVDFAANGLVKDVVLAGSLSIGAENVTVSADGYSFSGPGALIGSGAVVINPGAAGSTILNISNQLTEGVNVQSGTAVINSIGSGNKYTLANGAKIVLNPGEVFNRPIVGAGEITIETKSNVFYSNTITEASAVNLMLGVAGSLSGGVQWSSQFLAVMPANAQVNVTTELASAGYGVTGTSLTNSKLHLGAGVRLMHFYNPSEGGTTVVGVGELAGDAGSTVEGGWVNSATRGLNYHVGALNTDATFAGSFTNYGTITAAPLNIVKNGTGSWTLTGESPNFVTGSFAVNAGSLIINGTLGTAAIPVTVGANGKLSGTGTVPGAAVVNGTLEGSLNFSSSLQLNGTTKLVVGGFDAGEYDKLTVAGTLTMGGNLEVIISGQNPAPGTRIKLVDATAVAGTFGENVVMPINYSFDEATGELVYDGTSTQIEQIAGFSIYPTMVTNELQVRGNDIQSIRIFSVTGQMVSNVAQISAHNHISMSHLTEGVYLVHVGMNDGSVKVQAVVLKK